MYYAAADKRRAGKDADAAISLGMALINLVPAKIITTNDGYNMKLAMKNPADRKTIYQILQITGNQEQSLGEMPDSFFEYEDGTLKQHYEIKLNAKEYLENLLRHTSGHDSFIRYVTQINCAKVK